MPEHDLPTLDPMGDFGRNLFQRAEEARLQLRRLPQHAARKAEDALVRTLRPRGLTAGERRIVTGAWKTGADPAAVRLFDGPGTSPIAAAAFAKGNPAITLGNNIFFKPGRYRPDFSLDALDITLLVHEYTHVVQYRKMGHGPFFARYGADLHRHSYNPDKLYDYGGRSTTWAQETLEGQAEMAGVYAGLRNSKKAAAAAAKVDLERRLKGSGVYGL